MDYTVALSSGEVLSKKQGLLKPLGQIMRLDRERGRKGEAADVERSELKLKRDEQGINPCLIKRII